MTSINLAARQREEVGAALTKLSVPEELREEVLFGIGQAIAGALECGNMEALDTAVDEAWLAVSNHYRRQLATNLSGWVDAGIIDKTTADRMIERVPNGPGQTFAGLDAGVAAALGIVPQDKHKLILALHACYTPDAVSQVRNEIGQGLKADQETAWWLSMSSLCREQTVNAETFVMQVAEAMAIKDDPVKRVAAAMDELGLMRYLERVENGVGYGTTDGSIQGAYLRGCDVGVCDMRALGAPIFVGTFRGAEVNLSNFCWGTLKDERQRPMSGQIAPGFYKVADTEELGRLVAELKHQLKM